MFALFPGIYENLLEYPFPKAIHLSVRNQLNPQKNTTVTFAPSENLRFRRPTRDPHPTMTQFNFFQHSKMFSKTENFLLDNALYLGRDKNHRP